MTRGPEYMAGWHARYHHNGVLVIAEARHQTRKRFPRGVEVVRQMARGRPLAMVDEITHSWVLLAPSLRRRAVLRPNNNGSVAVTSGALRRAVYVSIEEAARRLSEEWSR